MANGVSEQNFLRLLFGGPSGRGGLQGGVDIFQQRQPVEADLLLQLQRMQQQQRQFEESKDLERRSQNLAQGRFEERLEFDKATQTAARMERAGEAFTKNMALSTRMRMEQEDFNSRVKLRGAQTAKLLEDAGGLGVSRQEAMSISKDYDRLLAQHRKEIGAAAQVGMTPEEFGVQPLPSWEEFSSERVGRVQGLRKPQASDGLEEPEDPNDTIMTKMIEGRKLSTEEALRAISIDDIFDPSDLTGNALAKERANDLFESDRITRKQYIDLLRKMGMEEAANTQRDIKNFLMRGIPFGS